MRRGLPEESWGAVSGVATRTVSLGKARARFERVVSKASCERGTRLTSVLLVVVVADVALALEERSIFVCAEAIVRCGLSRFGWRWLRLRIGGGYLLSKEALLP